MFLFPNRNLLVIPLIINIGKNIWSMNDEALSLKNHEEANIG